MLKAFLYPNSTNNKSIFVNALSGNLIFRSTFFQSLAKKITALKAFFG